MYGLYLVLVLIVTGGVIAFIGDRLGTKIGKKRLSIFGLRPRHTSNVITVLTGFVITALTIGIMALTSENVRTALFGMEELNMKLETKQQALENLTEEYQKSKIEVENLEQEQGVLKEENKTIELANAKLITDNEQLSKDNVELTTSNERLTNENEELVKSKEELEASNESLTKSNAELNASNEELKSDNKELEERNENLRDGIVAMREGDIVFRAGEILASGVIEGHRSAEEVVKDIDAMAKKATTMVSRRIGNSGDDSVWIYQPELSEAVKRISESEGEVVLRIAAAGNLMRGEPVRTSLELYKNHKIYDKEEFIVAKAYELREGIDSERIVRDFLGEVNRAAVSKGLLSDPITGTVGVMEGMQFYQVVDAVSEAKGTILLTAYARDATEAIGPLRLNVKLEQAKDV